MKHNPFQRLLSKMSEDDLISEFELIERKESKLPATTRYRIQILVQSLISTGQLKITNNKITKHGEDRNEGSRSKDGTEIKRSEGSQDESYLSRVE